jgi:hypothetical protein
MFEGLRPRSSHEHIGEGGYDAIEEEMAALLTEAARNLRTEAE